MTFNPSSSIIPFTSCLQSFPASGSFPMSVLLKGWTKYWSFSFSISPSNDYSGLISLGWTGLISLQSKGLSRVFYNTIVQKHQFFGSQLSLWSNSHPSMRVFSSESTLRMMWPKYWSFSFSISPSNEYSGLISLGWTGWISLQSKGLSRVFSNTTVQKHQFFGAQLSL